MLLRAVRRTSWAALICAARAGLGDLTGRREHLVHEIAELDEVGVDRLGRLVPRGGGAFGGGDASFVGEREGAAPRFGRGRLDQALVLELLQRRVDGARARRPVAAAPLGDDLDDLVAVHRLLGEEREDGGADVAAPGAAAGAEERPAEAARAVAVAPAAASRPVAGHEQDVRARGRRGSGPSEMVIAVMCVPFVRVLFLSCAITIYRNCVARQADNRPGG